MGNSGSSAGGAPAAPAEPSYFQQANAAYDQVVKSIIRPPRCEYEKGALGPASFAFVGISYIRKDFTVLNPRGMKVHCSHWMPLPTERRSETIPCVVYMHGNSSSRVEALPMLSLVLSMGATLLSFDFCGSGHSEGEVSMSMSMCVCV